MIIICFAVLGRFARTGKSFLVRWEDQPPPNLGASSGLSSLTDGDLGCESAAGGGHPSEPGKNFRICGSPKLSSTPVPCQACLSKLGSALVGPQEQHAAMERQPLIGALRFPPVPHNGHARPTVS